MPQRNDTGVHADTQCRGREAPSPGHLLRRRRLLLKSRQEAEQSLLRDLAPSALQLREGGEPEGVRQPHLGRGPGRPRPAGGSRLAQP